MTRACAVVLALLTGGVAHAQSRESETASLEARAWDAFVADQPTEAISACVALLDRAPAGTQHDEALVMLAALLADVDWDRDGRADATTPIARLSDPRLVPLDRPWAGELVDATAHALFLSSRDPEAIAVLAWASGRWSLPAASSTMSAACRRHRARPETLHREGAVMRAEASATCSRFGL